MGRGRHGWFDGASRWNALQVISFPIRKEINLLPFSEPFSDPFSDPVFSRLRDSTLKRQNQCWPLVLDLVIKELPEGYDVGVVVVGGFLGLFQ